MNVKVKTKTIHKLNAAVLDAEDIYEIVEALKMFFDKLEKKSEIFIDVAAVLQEHIEEIHSVLYEARESLEYIKTHGDTASEWIKNDLKKHFGED